MSGRYSWLDASRMEAIPIGGDPDDFVVLRQSHHEHLRGEIDPDFINLSFVGTFMPRTGPLIHVLFRAFRTFRNDHPELAARTRLNFIGTSNQPGTSTTQLVMPIAADCGIADHVRETPGRLPYLQALGILARSDGLLLIGSDEAHYTASKIYPGLMSGRPYLSIFHELSSAHAILSAAGGGISFGFRLAEELERLENDLADALYRLASDAGGFSSPHPGSYAPYEASATARRFASIFDLIV
jgi:hypothetical protein